MSTVTVSHGSSYSVSAGGTDNHDIVLSGGSMFVLSDGVADATAVSSGGFLTVDHGGTVSGTVLSGGTSASSKVATEIVESGGTALATVISPGGLEEVFGYDSGASVSGVDSYLSAFGGTQVIEAGGTASSTEVLSGGTLELLSGAVARGYTISSGGILEIASRYVLSDYTIAAATTLDVGSGGTAIGTIVAGGIDSPGVENVDAGGTDLNAQVSAGGPQTIYGYALSAVVYDNGEQDVDLGGTTSLTQVDSGGTQNVADFGYGDYGTAINTTISNGGTQVDGYFTGAVGTTIGTTIDSGGREYIAVEGGDGTAVGTTIAGGEQFVGFGGGFFGGAGGEGTAIDTTISAGAQFVGDEGGTGEATSTTIDSGAEQLVGYISGGVGVASNTTIERGGLQDVALVGGTGKTVDTVIDSGGTENVFGGGTISGTTISGGILQLGSGAVVDGGIVFSGSGGTLEIDGTAMPINVISGLAVGDIIDLPNVAFSNGGSATLEAGNILKIVEGGKTYELHLNPSQNLSVDGFTPSLDAGSGTKITVEPNPAAPTVVSATSPESGAYGVGRTVTFTLDMSLPAVVSGTPTLTLNDGGIATYVSGSGSDDLTFSYTVGSGQNAAQLTTSLSTLSGGTIDGLTGTPVSASTAPIKLATLGANTTMVPGGTAILSANTEAALQAAINIAAPGETIDPSNITLSVPLIIPTGTDVIIDGFGGGTGTFDAMQLNTTQPIIIEAGATAVFSYVDINFKEELGDAADGGNGDAGIAGIDGQTGANDGQPGTVGTFGGDGEDGGGGGAGTSLLGAIQNYGTLTLNQVAVVADSTAGGGGGGGKGGAGGAGGKGGDGGKNASPGGPGGAGASAGNGGAGGAGGGGGIGGTAVGGIYNGGTLTLEDTLVTGSATGGDGGDGGDAANGGDGGVGGNGAPGNSGGAGGNAGHGGNAGDAGNGGGGADGGAAVGGILNVGTLNVVGATAVLFGDSANGGNGGNGGSAGSAGTLGNAGTPGAGTPSGATSLPGSAGNDGADGGDGTDGSSVNDLSGATASGSVTIDHHLYEFDPKSLSPANVTLSSAGTKFTYEVDKYGPATGGSVHWQVVAGSSGPAPGDFVGATSGTLNFTGTTTSQTISFSVIPDLSEALNESFTIELSSPAAGDVLGTNSEIVQNVTNLNIDTWKAGASGDWSTTSDWSLGHVPAANTQAVLATGGTVSSTASDDPTVASIVTSHGATIDITGGTFTATIGTGTSVNAGAVVIANSATLELGGTAVNSGSIALNGSANTTQLEIVGAALTFTGGGKVMLSTSEHNTILPGGSVATLTNINNTVTGAGTIGNSDLTLINSGTVNANTLSALTINTGANAVINAGLLEATSTGGLIIDSKLSNSKTLEALGTSATVLIGNAVTVSNTSAGIISASGTAAKILFDNATILGGKLQTTGSSAAIETVSGSTNNILSGVTIAAGSLIEVTDGTELTLSGTVSNAGTIEVSATTDPTTLVLNGATVSGGKLQTLGSNAVIRTTTATADAIDGGTIVSGSLVEIGSASTLTLSGGTIGSGATVETTSSGTAVVSGTVTNSGTLFASGSGSEIAIVSGAVVNGGSVEVGNGIVDIAAKGGESVDFLSTGSGGLIIADKAGATTAYSGKISGFGGSGHTNSSQYIDLANVISGAGVITDHYTSANTSNTSGTLTVSSGGTLVASIQFVGAYSSGNFKIVGGSGGTVEITDPAVVNGGVANIALLGNYMAATFVTAADGHGSTLVTQEPDSQPPSLSHPHA